MKKNTPQKVSFIDCFYCQCQEFFFSVLPRFSIFIFSQYFRYIFLPIYNDIFYSSFSCYLMFPKLFVFVSLFTFHIHGTYFFMMIWNSYFYSSLLIMRKQFFEELYWDHIFKRAFEGVVFWFEWILLVYFKIAQAQWLV
jgi:hypothetical protein